MVNVLILGNNGMLGNAVEKILRADKNLNISTTSRMGREATYAFDALSDEFPNIVKNVKPDFIINCIGTIKPRIKEESAKSIEEAIRINSIFPHTIQRSIQNSSMKVIQIATDCVYSGSKGKYLESDQHDATDVYGKTKSLGEVSAENFLHIRASIVGPELGRSTSLLEWFLNQPEGAKLNGFANHMWNGVSTYQFAKIAAGVISSDSFIGGKVHLIPQNSVSKYELLNLFRKIYSRNDIEIAEMYPQNILDRTLGSENILMSNQLWNQAGYEVPPTIEAMLVEMKELSRVH